MRSPDRKRFEESCADALMRIEHWNPHTFLPAPHTGQGGNAVCQLCGQHQWYRLHNYFNNFQPISLNAFRFYITSRRIVQEPV